MSKFYYLLLSLLVLFIGCNSESQYGVKRKALQNPLSIGYIHQVFDMEQSVFLGYNACGPTSAVMIVRHHYLQPDSPNEYEGYYVYNAYQNSFSDASGGQYDRDYAMDMDRDESHIHNVNGAHGFIVVSPRINFWAADRAKLQNYLRNHGLFVKEYTYNVKNIVKESIDNGMPLIGYVRVFKDYGHYLVISGYTSDSRGNVDKVIVHDPHANAYENGWFVNRNNGINATYSFNDSVIELKRVYIAYPVGIYYKFPGWDKHNKTSAAFRDAYNEHSPNYHNGSMGPPWSNGPYGPYVHCWPDDQTDNYFNLGECAYPNALLVQDFLSKDDYWTQLVYNKHHQKVYPIHGRILEYWWRNWGYDRFGAPENTEERKSINSTAWHVQKFQYGWIGVKQDGSHEIRRVESWEFDSDQSFSIQSVSDNGPSSSSNSDDSEDIIESTEPEIIETSSNDYVSCIINCPYINDNQMTAVVWYGNDQEIHASSNTEFIIYSSELCMWERPSFEFNCFYEDYWGLHEDAFIECSDNFSISFVNLHSRIIFDDYNCSIDNYEDSSTEEPSLPFDLTEDSKDYLSCSISCPVKDGNQMNTIVWYGDDQLLPDESQVFSLEICQMCLWGEAAFEFNCFYDDFWGLHQEADISCDEEIISFEFNEHTRVKIPDFECWKCQ